MSDDGLLLNFTTSNAKLSEKQLAGLLGKKKGNWRDRVNAGAAAQEGRSSAPHGHKPRAHKTPSRRDGASAGARKDESRGSDGIVRKRSADDRPLNAKRSRTNARSGEAGDKSKDGARDSFVSSLFSYNPEIVHGERRDTSNEPQSAESTNAPLTNSSSFAVNDTLKRFLAEKMNFTAPTQIQSTAIPAISQTEQDVVMVAQTGSGKTLAYLLPIFSSLMNSKERIDRQSGIFAVILAPTRELASQIFQVCEEVCRCCHYIVPGLVIGGEKKKSEKARLRKGVNILIGTPGRMADHVDNTARLTFSKTKFVVLDEGDRLIEMGFEETVTQILASIPQNRKTILCSATMNTQATRLKTLALSEPVCWVREEQQENTPGQLVQRVSIVPAKLRLVTLAAKLTAVRNRSLRAIVFFSCTDSVDFHFNLFKRPQKDGRPQAPVFRLHGSMTQQQRSETLSEFLKSPNGGVLLTTDVASRGLDATVDEVIEYDPPFTVEDHLHRAGRTARAGKKGEALLFLLPSEKEYEEKISRAHNVNIKQETYQHILQRGFGYNDWMDRATAWQLGVEKLILGGTDELDEFAKRAFAAHIRAYTTHSGAEKQIFNLKEVHLGHLAKAFALRDAPTNIASGNSGNSSSKPKKRSPRQAMLEAAQRQLEVDEFHVMR